MIVLVTILKEIPEPRSHSSRKGKEDENALVSMRPGVCPHSLLVKSLPAQTRG